MTEPASDAPRPEHSPGLPGQQQQQQEPHSPETDASYEEAHVHAVYEAIADHFSATRYAPWPLVARFLQAQPPGSIGLDVGCGNGKYLGGGSGGGGGGDSSDGLTTRGGDSNGNGNGNGMTTRGPFLLGCDRSAELARLAYARHARAHVGADVLRADSLALPFRAACADFVVCIAVVHHLSTRARRQAAVAELLRCVGGETRTAKETTESAVEMPGPTTAAAAAADPFGPTPGRVLLYVWALEQASSRRGWAAGGAQDLLVPWVKTSRQKKKKDMDDHDRQQQQEQQPPPTFQRYYHLYREGELEEDVQAVGGRVVASGYEKDNWWVIAEVV